MSQQGRLIGIRHRVGTTVKGEKSPTQMCIKHEDGTIERYDVDDNVAALDWVLGVFVRAMRKVLPEDKPSDFLERQCEWRKLKSDESADDFPAHQVRTVGKKQEVLTSVPSEFDGLKDNDTILMVLGGSGGDLAAVLFRKGRGRGVAVKLVTPRRIKEERDTRVGEKDDDAALLIEMFEAQPNVFYDFKPRDTQIVLLRKAVQAWMDAQRDRIKCELRLIRRVNREVLFLQKPLAERTIEEHYDKKRASDVGFANALRIEKDLEDEVKYLMQDLAVYQQVFAPIKGIGEMLAARMIAGAGDIRRFPTDHAFVAYAGTHVKHGGKYGEEIPPECQFPRREKGEQANWSDLLRQGVYLFVGDQCVKRPDSPWGMKLNEIKVRLRAKHPEPVTRVLLNKYGNPRLKDGKPIEGTLYTDGHIHKMAIWRTATYFYRYIWNKWREFEGLEKPQRPNMGKRPRLLAFDGEST